MVREAKRARSSRRQLGQFLTPEAVAKEVAASALAVAPHRILEPSFGAGGFLIPVISRLLHKREGTRNYRLGQVLTENVWGVELDPQMYELCLAQIAERWGALPSEHNLHLGDYFRFEAPFGGFDLIIGNPPFGGTFDAEIEDQLDRRFGRYRGDKVRKETYSFFVAKAIEELSPGGRVRFICSDTFLTIKTMKGLRRKLMDCGPCQVDRLALFSCETRQPMVVLTATASGPTDSAHVYGQRVLRETMDTTANFSWAISNALAGYFDGSTLGDYVVATGGMTIGKNELFVRETEDAGQIRERYEFEFFDDPITLRGEQQRARLQRLSAKVEQRVREAEASGATRRNVRAVPLEQSREIVLPHPDYKFYNKACGQRLYAPPSHAVYWRNDGEAVLTFKKNGPWYLHGVGGRPFFFREGITWQLVAPRINARYLPPGYVLDSGAPCAFVREGVPASELWFVLGWLQTSLASRILKQVINHTRNIQGKDIERLPYPHWVAPAAKNEVAGITERYVRDMMVGSRPNVEPEWDALFGRPTAQAQNGCGMIGRSAPARAAS